MRGNLYGLSAYYFEQKKEKQTQETIKALIHFISKNVEAEKKRKRVSQET